MLNGISTFFFGTQPENGAPLAADVDKSNNSELVTTHPDENDDWLLVDSDVGHSTPSQNVDLQSTDTAILDGGGLATPASTAPTSLTTSCSEDLSDFERFRGPYLSVRDLEEHGSDAALSDVSSQPERVAHPSLDECWLVTPPPCFAMPTMPVTAVLAETSQRVDSLENLLIEHPSMSVYALRGRRYGPSDRRGAVDRATEEVEIRMSPAEELQDRLSGERAMRADSPMHRASPVRHGERHPGVHAEHAIMAPALHCEQRERLRYEARNVSRHILHRRNAARLHAAQCKSHRRKQYALNNNSSGRSNDRKSH